MKEVFYLLFMLLLGLTLISVVEVALTSGYYTEEEAKLHQRAGKRLAVCLSLFFVLLTVVFLFSRYNP